MAEWRIDSVVVRGSVDERKGLVLSERVCEANRSQSKVERRAAAGDRCK